MLALRERLPLAEYSSIDHYLPPQKLWYHLHISTYNLSYIQIIYHYQEESRPLVRPLRDNSWDAIPLRETILGQFYPLSPEKVSNQA